MGTDPLKTLVVDDEKPARDRLIHLLSKDKRVEVVGAAGNGPEAIDRVNEHHPHLILLDIQMPGMDGFDVVRMLNDPPLVIFTTAYDEYAIKAFEIHALDYLLKPIPQKRLSAAIGRAIQEWSAIDGGGRDDWQERLLEAVNAVSPPQRTLARVPVRAGETIRLIDLVDVLWFFVQDKLVSLVSAEGTLDTQYTTIQELEQKLDPEVFFRIHRSMMVNLNHVKEIQPWFSGTVKVVMDDAESTALDVSRVHARRLRRQIGW